jgi:ElaB/YqjD/DUF883 family membrane-anchored ribosome-binding protein
MEYAQTTKAPSSVEEIPTSTEEKLRTMRDTMDEYVTSASDKAREAAAYADRTVQQNPWTAVGVGFGAGVLVGALVGLLAAKSQHSWYDHISRNIR